MPKPRIPEDLKRRVLQALSEGRTQVSIAEELGIKQQKVTYIQRQTAMKSGGGETTDFMETESPREIEARSFINKALSSFADATSWRDVSKSAAGLETAIVVAEMASAEWKKAASKLRERKGNG